MDLTELSRLVANLIRVGTILDVDLAAVRVRVLIGKLESNWLSWLERRAGGTTTWDPPTIGEQCIVFAPSGELANAIVLTGLNSDAIQPPSHAAEKHVIRFPDGATFTYDHAASHLEITGIATATIVASESITHDTPLTHLTGKLVVDDLLTYKNGLNGSGGTDGNNNIVTGDFIHNDGDLSSNDVILHNHRHRDVIAGGDITGVPI